MTIVNDLKKMLPSKETAAPARALVKKVIISASYRKTLQTIARYLSKLSGKKILSDDVLAKLGDRRSANSTNVTAALKLLKIPGSIWTNVKEDGLEDDFLLAIASSGKSVSNEVKPYYQDYVSKSPMAANTLKFDKPNDKDVSSFLNKQIEYIAKLKIDYLRKASDTQILKIALMKAIPSVDGKPQLKVTFPAKGGIEDVYDPIENNLSVNFTATVSSDMKASASKILNQYFSYLESYDIEVDARPSKDGLSASGSIVLNT